MLKTYLVFGKFGGILGLVYGYDLTNAEFTAFRQYGDKFGHVQFTG